MIIMNSLVFCLARDPDRLFLVFVVVGVFVFFYQGKPFIDLNNPNLDVASRNLTSPTLILTSSVVILTSQIVLS